MKIAIPDVISNSYFPVIAACELGFFEREGVDMEFEAMRDGDIDFVGGSAHSVPFAFPGWKGGKLIAAQAQNMYWFLVLRSDLNAKKGEIEKIKGLNLGAAPLVNLGLKRLIVESGLDEERDGITIGPVPGAFLGENKNLGVAGVVRAIVKTQQALKDDVTLATKVGEKWFPELEASLIAQVVERDLPFYDASISREFVDGMLNFQRNMDLIPVDAEITYEDVVATQFAELWKP